MENDLVTVAIPAYNHQDYVQETIDSILKQTYTNIELVIFNDGSTDNTDTKIRERLNDCRNRFVRTEYISKQNEGLAATWNRAIDWSKSDYLYTIASDDIAKPHAIETLYNFLSIHTDYALAVGDNEIIDAAGQKCGWDKQRNNIPLENAAYCTFIQLLQAKRKNRKRFKPRHYGTYKTLIRGNYITNGKMYRKEALIKVGKFIPGMRMEDWYINLQLAKYYKMHLFNEVLLSYRWHETNTIKSSEYIKHSKEKLLKYESEHHPEWFKKHATRKIKKLIQ